MTEPTLDSSAIYSSLGEKFITAVDKFQADQCGASQTFQSDVFRAGVGQEVQRDAVQTVQSSAFQTVQKETLQLVCSGADQAVQNSVLQEFWICVAQSVQSDSAQTVKRGIVQAAKMGFDQVVQSEAGQAAQSCAVQEIVIKEDHLGKVQEDQSVKVCII